MKFKELLDQFDYIDDYIKRMKFDDGARRVNQQWFNCLKTDCDDRKLIKDEKELSRKLLSDEDVNNLIGFYIYRDIPLALCNDDYGQCVYFITEVNGRRIENSCGTYNPCYEEEAMDCIDYELF